jgi:magnesium-transporting ATPase (P-type)
MVYIETSNLDGETNLKIRQALSETNMPIVKDLAGYDSGMITDALDNPAILGQLKGTLTCEPPNNRLHDFEGFLEMDGAKFSLNANQLLLRGAQLRQTRWAVGLVVFSGYDTKVVRNSSKPPSKRSNIEKRTNDFIVVILSLMVLLCGTGSIAAVVWGDKKMGDSWWAYLPLRFDSFSHGLHLQFVACFLLAEKYISILLLFTGGRYLPDSLGSQSFITTFGTYLILLATMVPISLYVTMEVVKMIQAYHIAWDLDMYDPESDTAALVRSSGLNEELGQVEYIFSDKTGTLTQNLMEFRKCTVGRARYGKGTTEIGRAAAKRAGM